MRNSVIFLVLTLFLTLSVNVAYGWPGQPALPPFEKTEKAKMVVMLLTGETILNNTSIWEVPVIIRVLRALNKKYPLSTWAVGAGGFEANSGTEIITRAFVYWDGTYKVITHSAWFKANLKTIEEGKWEDLIKDKTRTLKKPLNRS